MKISRDKVLIAHMSDLHYNAKNLAEADRCFGFAIDDAIAQNCAGAVITGDTTDHALDGHAPSLRTLATQLKRLADHCPVLMVQGTFSHEPAGLLRMFELIGARHPICIADQIGVFGLLDGVGFEPYAVGTDYLTVVTAFPTVNKAELMSSGEASGVAGEMGELLFALLRQFGEMNALLKVRGVPTMVVGHGTVDSCITEHGVPMAGQDHEFGVGALFAANADAVALGHIHKHQVWERKKDGGIQRIAYAGSIGRFHHGEDGDKCYLMWDMVAGDSSFNAVTTPSRRTVDLFFNGPPDMEAIHEAAAACAGAFVRVRYAVDEEHKQSVDRKAIEAALSGAADVQIEGKNLMVERQRAAGISSTPSLVDKLGKWCALTTTPQPPLVDRLALIQEQEPSEVVRNILETIYGKSVARPAGHHVAAVSATRCGGKQVPSDQEPGNGKPERVPSQDGLFA